MCHSQWQRQTQRRRNGLEHSNFPHGNFQLFVVLIIVFAMCICSIAFADEWQELTEFQQQRQRATPLSFANAFNFGCWFYDFSLFRHDGSQLEMTDAEPFLWAAREHFSFYFFFLSKWLCVDECWWSRLIFFWSTKHNVTEMGNKSANNGTHSTHGFYDFCA